MRGIIYCHKCGFITDGTRIDKLADPCLLKPTLHGQRMLNNMARYPPIHPKGKRFKWPANPIDKATIVQYLDDPRDLDQMLLDCMSPS